MLKHKIFFVVGHLLVAGEWSLEDCRPLMITLLWSPELLLLIDPTTVKSLL